MAALWSYRMRARTWERGTAVRRRCLCLLLPVFVVVGLCLVAGRVSAGAAVGFQHETAVAPPTAQKPAKQRPEAKQSGPSVAKPGPKASSATNKASDKSVAAEPASAATPTGTAPNSAAAPPAAGVKASAPVQRAGKAAPASASAPRSGGGSATTPGGSAQPRSLPAGIDGSRRESELYGERLSRLESEVDDLKEKVFRTRARLALLKETVLHGVMAGTRTIIAHRNLMGSQFRLVKIVYFLDGAQVFARSDDDGALDSEEQIVIFDGNLVPGPHNVTLELTYRGRGAGLFSYLNGYVFESRSSHSFTAAEDAAVKLLSVGFEQGNLTTEMSDRPAVSWQELAIDAAGKPLGDRKKRRRGAPARGTGKRTTTSQKRSSSTKGN